MVSLIYLLSTFSHFVIFSGFAVILLAILWVSLLGLAVLVMWLLDWHR